MRKENPNLPRLKTWQMEFLTGNSETPRFVRIKDYTYTEATNQLFRMYTSANTTLISVKEIADTSPPKKVDWTHRDENDRRVLEDRRVNKQ